MGPGYSSLALLNARLDTRELATATNHVVDVQPGLRESGSDDGKSGLCVLGCTGEAVSRRLTQADAEPGRGNRCAALSARHDGS